MNSGYDLTINSAKYDINTLWENINLPSELKSGKNDCSFRRFTLSALSNYTDTIKSTYKPCKRCLKKNNEKKLAITSEIWIRPEILRDEAILILTQFDIGIFLVRLNTKTKSTVLSFKTIKNKIEHIKIKWDSKTGFFMDGSKISFPNANTMISYYMNHSIGLDVLLQLPKALCDDVENKFLKYFELLQKDFWIPSIASMSPNDITIKEFPFPPRFGQRNKDIQLPLINPLTDQDDFEYEEIKIYDKPNHGKYSNSFFDDYNNKFDEENKIKIKNGTITSWKSELQINTENEYSNSCGFMNTKEIISKQNNKLILNSSMENVSTTGNILNDKMLGTFKSNPSERDDQPYIAMGNTRNENQIDIRNEYSNSSGLMNTKEIISKQNNKFILNSSMENVSTTGKILNGNLMIKSSKDKYKMWGTFKSNPSERDDQPYMAMGNTKNENKIDISSSQKFRTFRNTECKYMKDLIYLYYPQIVNINLRLEQDILPNPHSVMNDLLKMRTIKLENDYETISMTSTRKMQNEENQFDMVNQPEEWRDRDAYIELNNLSRNVYYYTEEIDLQTMFDTSTTNNDSIQSNEMNITNISNYSENFSNNEKSIYRKLKQIYSINNNNEISNSIRVFVQCTIDRSDVNPYVTMKLIRQYMLGLYRFILKTNDQTFKNIIENTSENEVVDVPSVLKSVLTNIVIKPLTGYIYRLLILEHHSKNNLYLISNGIDIIKNIKPEKFGLQPISLATIYDKIQIIEKQFESMAKQYSPEKKLTYLINAINIIIELDKSIHSTIQYQFNKPNFKMDHDMVSVLIYIMCRMKSVALTLQCEVEYMEGLLWSTDSLNGKIGYHIMSLMASLEAVKVLSLGELDFDDVLILQDNQLTISNKSTLFMKIINSNCVTTGINLMLINIYDDRIKTIHTKTYPIRSTETVKILCNSVARSIGIVNAADHGLFKIREKTGLTLLEASKSCIMLKDSDYPQLIKEAYQKTTNEKIGFLFKRKFVFF